MTKRSSTTTKYLGGQGQTAAPPETPARPKPKARRDGKTGRFRKVDK
jgi:hypothetical protein